MRVHPKLAYAAIALAASELAARPDGLTLQSAEVTDDTYQELLRPVTLLKAGRDALKLVTFQANDLKLKRLPNSVDTLAPNNRFVKAINTIPVTPGIPYHVICGDRGKGGHRDQTKPCCSDGVVPCWSGHLDGAESEPIVPSSHSAHQNPQAIAEVDRILKLHGPR